MLSKEMRRNFRTNFTGVKNETKSVYLVRVKKQVDQALKDLSLLADELPEKQQREVFTAETLRPFISAVVMPRTGIYPLEKRKNTIIRRPIPKDGIKNWEERRRRIQSICKAIMGELWLVHSVIAPNATDFLIRRESEHMVEGLRALLIGY